MRRRRGISTATKRLVGLSTLAGALLVLFVTFNPPVMPWAAPIHVHLQAGDFGELNRAASVELGGVKVGSVEAVRYQGGRAVLDLAIERRFAAKLHNDAAATIQPHGLLGPKYVLLEGGHGAPMADGGTIPISRVHVTQDLDQVLSALQPDVRESLKVTLVELAKGSDGRGTDVNQAIAALAASSADLRTTADTLSNRSVDLADFFAYSEQLNRDLQYAPIDAQIADTDPVLKALVSVEAEIGQGIDSTAGTTRSLDQVMNGNQQNLATLLARAPDTMTKLRTAAATGDRLVTGVNPALPYLMTAVVETKSAFSYTDANGHYVKVIAISGSCSAGLPGAGSCSTPDGNASPDGGPKTQSAPAAPPPSSTSSDQQLINMIMGSGG